MAASLVITFLVLPVAFNTLAMPVLCKLTQPWQRLLPGYQWSIWTNSLLAQDAF
ncbi:hypothetical protein ACE3G8_16880 [Vreelandella venusta]